MRSLWIAVALVPALALTASAQVRVDVNEGGVKVDTPAGRVVGAADYSGATFRSSKLVGMSVKNSKNQDLGKIEDLVIDERGHVRYAAISFGGFLGFNNKYFAVPWRSLKVKHDAGSSSHYVELNVTKEYLDNANGFASDKWPDFADPEMNKKIDAYWQTEVKTPTTLPRQ
ncbi:PRC-barrel domain-containing protein [Anatilimnocola floriformis]|uniref:PRC-barrel domain-containing protein n=1 Tax=Anatilimnocola floriformis TaxID=2948575 RepID=UPI0020C4E47F|nr:PRC-barrel domain-containing protein [Anatilimnocola floriformis]